MRTFVYIDGFNLYYRMLKARPHLKWLNPKLLCENILDSSHRIERVNYYTARVSSRAYDLDAPAKQAIYLSALSSIPEMKIHQGNFLTNDTWMPFAKPNVGEVPSINFKPDPQVVKVTKSEEKGSDVNLAAHLVRDAYLGSFDVAIVITNDSDLVEPIRIAVSEARKKVGLLMPVKYPNPSLTSVASFYLHIRPQHLKNSQFPDSIILAGGDRIFKPKTWTK